MNDRALTYDLINPSDPVTFRAPSHVAATVAVTFLGNGKYGARQIDENGQEVEGDELDVPMFMFGGFDEWLAERHLTQDVVMVSYTDDIAATLESFCTGGMKDRRLFERALAAITDDEKRAAFVADWDDKKRSSLNQITNSAHDLARRIREAKW